MNYLHEYLKQRSSTYAKWHDNPASTFWHFAILILVAISVGVILPARINAANGNVPEPELTVAPDIQRIPSFGGSRPGTHLLIPRRDGKGLIRHGLRNEISSSNWSGFVVTGGKPYTKASGRWVVPAISYDGGTTPYGYEYVTNWIGIGGYSDNDIVQLGSESLVSTSGQTTYYTWYEFYPANSVAIPHTPKPGDVMTASIECTASCTTGTTQTWLITMSDLTAGWTWSQTSQFASSLGSVEWISEAPYYNGVLPLGNYGKETFDSLLANSLNPNITIASNGIVLYDPWNGETSNVSAPLNGNSFSTCWGNGGVLAPCTTGTIGSTPAPTATFSANPTSITVGASSTLTWSSANATSCTGTGFSTGGATNGSATVSPSSTTTYSLSCSGSGGSTSAQVTVTVSASTVCTPNAPTVALSPVTQNLADGQTVSYTVEVTDTDTTACSAATFNLNTTVPSGWNDTLSPTSLTLTPGVHGTATVSVTSSTSSPNGSYTITASATDAVSASHTGSGTAAAVIQTPDTTPPTVMITQPADGSSISRTNNVKIAVSASDDTGVTKVDLFIDGAYQATDSAAPYTFNWNVHQVSKGTHTIMAKAYDAAGNVGTASISVTK